MLNKVILIGRLTTRPELKYTSSDLPFARFSVAVNRAYSNSEGERETDFINVIVWRKQAENVCNYLDKGSLVMVEGSISTNSYDDKDGNRRHSTEIMAQNVQFLNTRVSKETSEPEETYETDDEVDIDDNFLD